MARTTTTGGGEMTKMWRSVHDDGDAIEVEPDGLYKLVLPDRDDECSPPKGTRAKLRISGISEPFEMPSYNDANVMEAKVRVEFQILNLSGKNIEWMKGKRFSQMVTDKVSAKSALGQLFATLSGQPIPAKLQGYPYDGYIDTEFISLIAESDKGYPRVEPAGIETAKTVLSPAVRSYFTGAPTPSQAREPELAGVGATAGGADDDPFLHDDL